jgi:hypothetical protein
MNFSLQGFLDTAQTVWSQAYATTDLAHQENYSQSVIDASTHANGPVRALGLESAYIGEWHRNLPNVHSVSATAYEIFCICEDYHRRNNQERPLCSEFIYIAAAQHTVELFGILQDPTELEDVLHTLLITDRDIDPALNDNYDPLFAQIDPTVAGKALWGYYLLRIHFEAGSCRSVTEWILTLGRIVNDNYSRAEALGTSQRFWGRGNLHPVPLQFKRSFTFGELPTDDWNPTPSIRSLEANGIFLFIKARNDGGDFEVEIPRQRPQSRYGYGINDFFVTR